MSQNLNYVFLDPMTRQCMNLITYHDMVMIVSTGVMGLVVWFLSIFWHKKWFFGNISNYKFYKNRWLEFFWTLIPMFILSGLGYESLSNLCAGEVSDGMDYKVKITAHQWYWSYEYLVGGRHKADPFDVKEEKFSIMARYKALVELEKRQGVVNKESEIPLAGSSGLAEKEVVQRSPQELVLQFIMVLLDAKVLSKAKGFSYFSPFDIEFLRRGYRDFSFYAKYSDCFNSKIGPKVFLWDSNDSFDEFGNPVPSKFISGPLGWKIYPSHLESIVKEAMKNGQEFCTPVCWEDFYNGMPKFGASLGDHVGFWLASVCRLYGAGSSGFEGSESFEVPSWNSYITLVEIGAAMEDMFLKNDSSWIDKLSCEVRLGYENFTNLRRELIVSYFLLEEAKRTYESSLAPENFYKGISLSEGYWGDRYNSSTFPGGKAFFSGGYGGSSVVKDNLESDIKNKSCFSCDISKLDLNKYWFLNSDFKNFIGDRSEVIEGLDQLYKFGCNGITRSGQNNMSGEGESSNGGVVSTPDSGGETGCKPDGSVFLDPGTEQKSPNNVVDSPSEGEGDGDCKSDDHVGEEVNSGTEQESPNSVVDSPSEGEGDGGCKSDDHVGEEVNSGTEQESPNSVVDSPSEGEGDGGFKPDDSVLMGLSDSNGGKESFNNFEGSGCEGGIKDASEEDGSKLPTDGGDSIGIVEEVINPDSIESESLGVIEVSISKSEDSPGGAGDNSPKVSVGCGEDEKKGHPIVENSAKFSDCSGDVSTPSGLGGVGSAGESPNYDVPSFSKSSGEGGLNLDHFLSAYFSGLNEDNGYPATAAREFTKSIVKALYKNIKKDWLSYASLYGFNVHPSLNVSLEGLSRSGLPGAELFSPKARLPNYKEMPDSDGGMVSLDSVDMINKGVGETPMLKLHVLEKDSRSGWVNKSCCYFSGHPDEVLCVDNIGPNNLESVIPFYKKCCFFSDDGKNSFFAILYTGNNLDSGGDLYSDDEWPMGIDKGNNFSYHEDIYLSPKEAEFINELGYDEGSLVNVGGLKGLFSFIEIASVASHKAYVSGKEEMRDAIMNWMGCISNASEKEKLTGTSIDVDSIARSLGAREGEKKLFEYFLMGVVPDSFESVEIDVMDSDEIIDDPNYKTVLELEADSFLGKRFQEKFSEIDLSLSLELREKLSDLYKLFLKQYDPGIEISDINVFSYKADHYGLSSNLFSHLLSLGSDMSSWDVDGFGLDYLLSEFSRDGSTTDWLYLPAGCNTEIVVTSADVIHSWGVPSLGVKVDAIPGRLNRVMVNPLYVGVAFGNCYELCGYGHSIMPINVMVVSEDYYFNYLHKDLIGDYPLGGN